MKQYLTHLVTAALPSICLASSALAVDPVKLSFFVFAGNGYDTVPKEVIAAYNKAYPNVQIVVVENTNAVIYPQMVTTRRTTPDDPLIHCGFFNSDSVFKGDVDDMWESLDAAHIPNMANTVQSYARPDNRGVPYATQVYGLLYNTDFVKTPPTSWAAMWDPAYKGHAVSFDYDTKLIAVAAKLNGGDERHPDAGFKVLGDNAQNFVALPSSNDGLKNLMASGDGWIVPWVNSISDVWIKEGAPLAFAVPKEGVVPNPIFLTISKGVTAEERKVCEELINTLLEPENAGRAAGLTSSIPLTTNVKLPPEQLANPMLSPATAEHLFVLDNAYIASVTSAWRERWDREFKAKMR